MTKEQIYYVKGMHCASCEILIEKKILDIRGVKSVEASTAKGMVVIEYENEKPDLVIINNIFKKDNYTFFDKDNNEAGDINKKPLNKTLVAFVVAVLIILAFLFLNEVGIAGILNISSSSSLVAFFGFGVLAGLSSCAALVGGIVLSMSKKWQDLYKTEKTTFGKLQPHFLFNMGRIISYIIFGGLLGLLGSRLQLSLSITSFLIFAISFLMIAFGLQMVGVRAFRRFQVSMPKSITRYIANENNFNGKYMPFIMGAGTFFLPCGFTITVQSLALLSGSMIQGSMIMGYFVLGTTPMLLLIGLSSVKLMEKPHLAETFSKVAGFLLLFFAVFNISNQMSVLGIAPSSFLSLNQSQSSETGLASVVEGKQLLKMTVEAIEYKPSYFKVKSGIPVRWEVTSSGKPSCGSGAIVANRLLDDVFYLDPTAGAVSVKEFTPKVAGKYRFTCTMGMFSGTIEVIN